MIEARLKGVEKTLAVLNRMDDEVHDRVMRKVTRAGGNIMLPAARQSTGMFRYRWPLPQGRRKGDLKRGLKVRAMKRNPKMVGVSVISSLKDKSSGASKLLYFGAFVNWGHKIGRRPGKGRPDHRGKVKPVPYMNVAFKKSKRQAVAVMSSLFRLEVKAAWLKFFK